MSFAIYKTVASLPSTLEPNAVYLVRVGTGFDLYVSDMTGNHAHKVNGIMPADLDYWRETMSNRLMLYTQSRGQQLVTNGTGLMGDNTNFSHFIYDASDVHSGFGAFKTSVHNFNRAIDEFIAVDTAKSYEFSFWIKNTIPQANNKAYAFIECFDVDKQSIQPHNLPVLSLRVTKSGDDLIIHDDDLTAFTALYNRHKNGGQGFYLSSYEYRARTGFVYPAGTYTRTHYTRTVVLFKNTQLVGNTWSGVKTQGMPDGYVTVTLTGGSYIYPFTNLSNHDVPATWTRYTKEIKGSEMRPATALVKVGWLLNRGAKNAGNETAINAVAFKEL